MPTQYPANQLAVGGQGTLSGWDVNVTNRGFVEDPGNYKWPDGRHKVKIVFSRRRTWDLTLQAQFGTNQETLRNGGAVTFDGVLCNIENYQSSSTHEPVTATLTLIEQGDSISA
jgi:hypothetical protein